MTIRKLLTVFILLASCMATYAITDNEVIAYIKQASAAGKTDKQIGRELMAKGVTPEQVKRIKAKYEKENGSATGAKSGGSGLAGAATRKSVAGQDENRQLNSIRTEEEALEDQVQYDADGKGADVAVKKIYGHEVFNSRSLTFEPNENVATPQNYRLGPGDEVVIDVWGTSESHQRQTITSEGNIMIEGIGPIFLNGLTIQDANKKIRAAFSNRFAGVGSEETDMTVTLGQVRTIQIDVMGEVATPGTFRLSPFSTVFHALYRAGGINDIGSMRNIRVMRNGRRVATVDIYDYLFKGKQTGNIRLQEGDVIIVPPYSQLVTAEGNVKRPMLYEIEKGETLNDLLKYAGGFTGDAYSGMVTVQRQAGSENELNNVSSNEFASFRLQDGDYITIGAILDRFANRVEITGAVMRPGMYAIEKGTNTIRELIKRADGLAEDAYTARAILYREGSDLVPEATAVDLAAILEGRAADITLKKNDVLVVSSLKEMQDLGPLTIHGLVAEPGEYPYAKNMTIEDLILQAGGLLQGASTARVEVARRIVDPAATAPSVNTAQTFTFSLKNGLVMDAKSDFYLKPYDVVEVRTSPGYEKQRFVNVAGEVLFPGSYVLVKRNERISDVIRRAGGVIDDAYIKGARLSRVMNEDEKRMRDDAMRLAMANSFGSDSISMNKIQLSDRYYVGIYLDKALAQPGGTYDMVLQEGDSISIPQQMSTVKISGEVLYPNTVVYEPKTNYKHYIDQAGGYSPRAKKSSAFIIYANGSVARLKGKTPIEPGSHIVIPSKPEGKGVDWMKIMSLVSSFGSVATMAATVASLFKK